MDFKICFRFQVTQNGQHVGVHEASITYTIMTQWAAKINKTSIKV